MYSFLHVPQSVIVYIYPATIKPLFFSSPFHEEKMEIHFIDRKIEQLVLSPRGLAVERIAFSVPLSVGL